MSTYHGSVSATIPLGTSLTYLPEVKAVGGHVVEDWTLFFLYLVLEQADLFPWVDFDSKHVFRIVREYPAV
jgi:hypothetical protein